MNEIMQKNLQYKKYVIDSNLEYFKPHSTKIEKTFAEDVSYSLNRDSKFISPKYFYDKKEENISTGACLI
ncbi:MAG: L-histidine N(alpha)-methyltransferase, partial [Nitrosopumilaceae archaeon]